MNKTDVLLKHTKSQLEVNKIELKRLLSVAKKASEDIKEQRLLISGLEDQVKKLKLSVHRDDLPSIEDMILETLDSKEGLIVKEIHQKIERSYSYNAPATRTLEKYIASMLSKQKIIQTNIGAKKYRRFRLNSK